MKTLGYALNLIRGGLIFALLGTLWWMISFVLTKKAAAQFGTRLCRLGFWLGGVALVVEDPEGLRARLQTPHVVVINHVSLLDPFVLQAALGVPLNALLFFKYGTTPLWGAITRRLGLILIDNHSPTSGAAALCRARQTLEQGTSVIVMPEGKMTKSGELGSFQPGAALLAQRAGAPILPLVQTGNFELWQPTQPRLRIGKIHLCALESEQWNKFNKKPTKEVTQMIRDRIETALGPQKLSMANQ